MQNVALDVGDRAPDLEFLDTAGQTVHLSDYWRTAPVMLIFLRTFA